MNYATALFHDFDAAQQAVECLQKEGFSHREISMLVPNTDGQFVRSDGAMLKTLPGLGDIAIIGPARERMDSMEAELTPLLGWVRDGGTVILVHSAERAEEAAQCMGRFGRVSHDGQAPVWVDAVLDTATMEEEALAGSTALSGR